MITLGEIEEVLASMGLAEYPEEEGTAAWLGLTEIVEREKSLTDPCPVCMGTGGYWTDGWQEDSYCSGTGLVTADRG